MPLWPLAESRHILLVYSTDALNSNAQFDAPDRTVLRQIGKLPVLLRTGEVKLSLRNKNPGMQLWALGLDGVRKEQLRLSTTKAKLSLSVNTATLTNGPTPFFELATK